jgi:hypothetical protein
MSWSQENIYKIYAKVMQKATIDEEFRKELLQSPNQAVAKLIGEELPDDFKIKVLERDPNYTATFVLPELLVDELDFDDLDNVAGGASQCTVQGISFCGVVMGEEDQNKSISPTNSNKSI